MIVSRDQLEAGLARASAGVREARFGIYGPESVTWQLNREAVNFLGAGRAALLQLAHPFVAQGVDEHSRTRTDARGRFERTFAAIFAMNFGDLDQALRAARRVFAIHNRVRGVLSEDVGMWRRGTPYAANDARALLWVHVTLIDTVLAVRERVFGLDAYRAEQYYQESKRFTRLFGIPDELVPADRAALSAYVDRMIASGEVAVSRAGRELAAFVLATPTPAVRPVMDWYRIMTAGLLPAPLRQPFGFRFGRVERALFAASLRAVRPAVRALPRQVRYLPGYLEAEGRLGLGGQRFLGRLAERATLTGMGLWSRPARAKTSHRASTR